MYGMKTIAQIMVRAYHQESKFRLYDCSTESCYPAPPEMIYRAGLISLTSNSLFLPFTNTLI